MMTILDNQEIRERLKKVLERLQLPTECNADPYEIIERMKTDKKSDHDSITVVQVDEIGKGYLEQWSFEQAGRKLGI